MVCDGHKCFNAVPSDTVGIPACGRELHRAGAASMAQVLHQAAQPKEQQDPPLCHCQQIWATCTVGLAGQRLFFPLPKDGKGPSLHMEGQQGWAKGFVVHPSLPWGPVQRLCCGPSLVSSPEGIHLQGLGPEKYPPALSPSSLCHVKEKLAAY